jgi:putative peptidoglycan lipid II flippase
MDEPRREDLGDHKIPKRLVRRILLSASWLGLMVIGGKLLGFVEKLLQARVLGTSAELDAYLVAISIPLSMYFFTREVVEPSVLPVYLSLKQKTGLREARRFAGTVGIVILGVCGLVAAAMLLDLDRAVSILAPGMAEETAGLAARLCRVTVPAGLMFALTALTGIVLNAHRKFVLPAFAEIAMKAVLAAGFGLAVMRWGIIAMGPAFALACAARLAVHAPVLARTGGVALPVGPRNPAIHQALRLAAPLVLGMLFSQLGSLADNFFGSQMGPGVISAVSFGRKLADLPLLVVSYSISVVVFPYFADLHIGRDHEALSRLLRKMLRLAMLVFAWATVVAVPLSSDIVRVVFERGAFGARSVDMTSPILACYAAGFVPLAIESILLQHFFARRDVVRPVAVGIAGVIVHIALVAFTWRWLGPASIALSYVIAKSLKVAVLLKLSRSWTFSLSGELGFFLRLAAAVAASGAVTAWISTVPALASQAPLLRLAVLGLAATALFGLGVYLTKVLADLRDSLRQDDRPAAGA